MNEDKIKDILKKISEHTSNIHCDWTDPRDDCRAIYELLEKAENQITDLYEPPEELKNPYPEKAFPSYKNSELGEIANYLVAGGYSPDRYNGSWGRQVWDLAVEQAKLYYEGRNDESTVNSGV